MKEKEIKEFKIWVLDFMPGKENPFDGFEGKCKDLEKLGNGIQSKTEGGLKP